MGVAPSPYRRTVVRRYCSGTGPVTGRHSTFPTGYLLGHRLRSPFLRAAGVLPGHNELPASGTGYGACQ